ncbi:MAG: hypothetical protein ABI634_00165 [Acidobacteriota bacterium]
MAKKTPQQHLDSLKQKIESRVDDLDRRIAATEDLLLERRAAVEPAEAPLLPVLRRRRSPRKKTGT